MRSHVSSLLLLLIVAVWIPSCTKEAGRLNGNGPDDKSQSDQNNYYALVHQANDSREIDDLDKFFSIEQTTSFDGANIKDIGRLKSGTQGGFYLADPESKFVMNFDKTGKLISRIGSEGDGPGQFQFPSGIAERDDAEIAVSDFKSHRVNVFSDKGDFLSSFIYSPQNFSAQNLIFNTENKSYYLFGNRWAENEKGEITGAKLVHKYSDRGEFVGSFLDFPDNFKDLNLYNYSLPSVDSVSGTVYIAMPFEYAVYQLGSDDKLDEIIKAGNGSFRSPSTKLDLSKTRPDAARTFVQGWLTTWTPIVGLAVVGNRLFLQYQTFNPQRYTVDVWSLSSRHVESTFKTNCRILDRSGNSVYFLRNVESAGERTYEVVRAEPK
ncbi:MAG: 6-bladed beta-propeller [Acidobacteriota bacterium]